MILILSCFLCIFWLMLSRFRASGLPILVPTALSLLVLASSCFFPTGSEKAKPVVTARVLFSISEPQLRSLGNPGSMNQVESGRGLVYDPAPLPGDLLVFLEGTGPGNALLTAVSVTGSVLELSLSAGDWVFQARAVDGGGSAFLAGTASARVDPATGAQVAITLSPVPGQGTLTIGYSTPAEVSASSIWTCTLSDQEGTLAAAWDDPLAVSSRTVADIPSGYYLLASRLMAGGLPLAGSVDLVRVLAGRTTAVPLSLEVPLAGIGLDMKLDHQSPVAVSAALLSRAAVRGFPLRVQATGPSGSLAGFPSGVDYRWSAMGTSLAQGELADIPTRGLPRSGVIDLVGFTGTNAGAGSLAYSLAEPVVREGWSLYATLGLVAEPLSQVLVRPAMLAVSQALSQGGSGKVSGEGAMILAVASDGTSSKLELWKPHLASGELVPGAFTTIRIGGTAKRASVLAISGDGSYVGAAASESSWIWLVPVAPDGSLGIPVEFAGGLGDLSGMGYVRGLAFSPSADRLYALSNADRSLYVFQRTGLDWALLQRFALDDQPCGTLSVLRALAISQDGSRLAVAAASSDTVVILEVDPGGLVWRSEARRTAGFAEIDYPQALVFSPTGTPDGTPQGSLPGSKLAVGCKDSGALVILDVDAVPPVTASVCKVSEGLPGVPTSLSWSADGRFIGLSSSNAATIICLDTVGQPQGSPVFDAADAAGLAAPAGVAMVGQSLYLACPDSQALVIIGYVPE